MSLRRLTIGAYRGERGRNLAAPRRRRRSRRQVVGRIAAVAGLVAVLAGGVYWSLTAPFFAVARVESGRFRYTSKPALDAALQELVGRNIWRLTTSDVAVVCVDLPFVREVRLQRNIPDTIVVELLEWRPLLVIDTGADDGVERILVEDGRILAVPEHLGVPGLPILVDCRLEPDGLGAWRPVDLDLAMLLDLIQAIETTGLESTTPVDFVRHTETGFVLELKDRAASLVLGNDGFERRLSLYLLAPEQVPEGATADLRFEDRIITKKM